jgi:ABC-type sulfate transport system substrate-binding protein
LPIGLIILGTTAVVTAIAQVDILRPHLPQIVGGLVLLEFATLVLLMKRTALGSWLTAWETLFDDRAG